MYAHNASSPAIRTALAVFDPMGLLAVGCPDDEYDLEENDLLDRLYGGEPLDAFLVMDVFYEWFDEVLPLGTAQGIAQLIQELA